MLFYNTPAGELKTFDKADIDDLSQRWTRAIKDYPLDYLVIRYRAFQQLVRMGESTPAWVAEPKIVENPWGFSFTSNSLSEALMNTTKTVPFLFFPWIYIIIVIVCGAATKLVAPALRRLNLTLAASAIAFTAPHLFLAPASDYRYLHFVTMCALIQATLLLASVASRTSRSVLQK